MYQDYFQLNSLPFSVTPNVDFFCNLKRHNEVIQLVMHTLNQGDGFIKIVGEVGTGKTLLSKKIFSLMDDSFVPCYIANPDLSPDSFREAIALELGLEVVNNTNQHALLSSINKKLNECFENQKKVVVIVDEAQAMGDNTLECLRLLTNLETKSSRLLQVILVGQPELEFRLSRIHLRQLRQRITLNLNLDKLNDSELSVYLTKRLTSAGHPHGFLFNDNARKFILKKTYGVPRLINIISHKSLLAAYNDNCETVQRSHVKLAVKESKDILSSLKSNKKNFISKYYIYIESFLLLFAFFILVYLFYS